MKLHKLKRTIIPIPVVHQLSVKEQVNVIILEIRKGTWRMCEEERKREERGEENGGS